MVRAIRGIYRDGTVELLEPLFGVTEGEIIVMTLSRFSEGEAAPPECLSAEDLLVDDEPKRIYFGMFEVGTEQFTEADFKAAEFGSDAEGGSECA